MAAVFVTGNRWNRDILKLLAYTRTHVREKSLKTSVTICYLLPTGIVLP